MKIPNQSERSELLDKSQSIKNKDINSNLPSNILLQKEIISKKSIDKPSSNQNQISNDIQVESALDDNIIEFKKKTKCTYYTFGNAPTHQKIFYCETCDPNNTEKICEECFISCHSKCCNESESDKDEDFIEEEAKKTEQFCFFICECGIKKHILNKKVENSQGSECLFLELDYKLHNKAVYSCRTCNINSLCYICYLKCHGTKQKCMTKKKLTNDSDVNKNKLCQCTHENHGSRIILNKFMNNIFNSKGNYDTIPFIWKSQILNCVFDGSIYKILYESMYSYILVYNSDIFSESKIDDIIIDTFARFVINISKTKKFYYLHENLIDVIPISRLLKLINSFQFNQFVKYSTFISGLITLLLVLYLKKDFQHLKSLCYKDFLITNALERINMKKMFFTKSIYTKDIFAKYTEEKSEGKIIYILPDICIHFVDILLRALNEYEEKSYGQFITSYMVILQMAYFCLKRFLFDKSSLLKLIDSLEKFCIAFNKVITTLLTAKNDNETSLNEIDKKFSLLNIEGNNEDTGSLKSNFKLVNKIMGYISKIIYVLMVNYNDIVIENLLNNTSDNFLFNKDDIITKAKSKFIHFYNPHSKKVFKMLISTSLVYNTFYLNSELTDKQGAANAYNINLINFVNQSLEMFTLSDNLYYKRLCSISLKDFSVFERFGNKICDRAAKEEELEISYEKKQNFSAEVNEYFAEIDSYMKLNPKNNIKNLNNSALIEIYNMLERLESVLKLFFYSKISYEQLDEKYYEILLSFGKGWSEEDFKIEEVKKKKKNNSKLKERRKEGIVKHRDFQERQTGSSGEKKENIEVFIESLNKNLLKSKSISDYHEQISLLTQELFSFLDEKIIYDEDRISVLVDELIFSSIDNNLTKLFLLDPERERYSEKTVDIIFTFLYIFCLNKSGLKHLLIGRNLGRIKEIFRIFPMHTLKFLSIITKGIYVYDIDMSEHKQIPIILNIIYSYIKRNIEEDSMKTNKNNIYECIIYTMEILYYLSSNFEIESLTRIKLLIVEQLKKILTKEKIFQTFPFKILISKYFHSNTILNNLSIYNIINKTEDKKDEKYYLIKEHQTFELSYIRKLFNNAKGDTNKYPPFTEIKREPYHLELDDNHFLDRIFKILKAKSNIKSLPKDTLNEPMPFESNIVLNRKNNHQLTINNIVSKFPKGNKTKQYTKKTNSVNEFRVKQLISDQSIHSISEESNNSNKESKLEMENKEILKNQKFFFSLIKLLSNITYFFVIQNDTFSAFEEINDLIFFKELLKENYLDLKDRTTLLVYIRMVYINDQIDSNGSLSFQKYLNSQEYSEALKDLRVLVNDKKASYLSEPIEYYYSISDKDKDKNNAFENLIKNNTIKRLENINNLKLVIEIFINELQNMYYFLYIEKKINDIDNYIKQILFSVKLISDIFITYELCSHMTLWFYEITKEFLIKVDFFIKYLSTINSRLEIDNIELKDEINNIKTSEMEKKSFDIYNTEKIYGLILEGFQEIFDITNFNDKFKLYSFISNYVLSDEKNFKNFTLNKTEIPFFSFLNTSLSELTQKENNVDDQFKGIPKDSISPEIKNFLQKYKTFSLIKQIYVNQFNNFFETVFYELICCSSYEMNLNSNEIFLNYCVVYIYNIKRLPSESMVTFLTMLNKLLIYEPLNTQKSLSNIFQAKNLQSSSRKMIYEELFFDNLTTILQEKININIATCKNIVIYNRYEKINTTTKTLIQFFQLLGEDHNKNFHNLIVSGQKNFKLTMAWDGNQKENVSAFNIMVTSLGHIIKSFDVYQNLIMKGELPFDKLIVMTKNIVDFIIEYFQGTSLEKYKIMFNSLRRIFPQIRSFVFYQDETEDDFEESNEDNIGERASLNIFKEKRNVIFTIKIILIELISSLIEEGNADNAIVNTLNEIIENFPPIELYEEAVKAMIFISSKHRELSKFSIENENIIPILMELYKYNDHFQNSIYLKWALKIFYYIKILSDVYDRAEVTPLLKNFKQMYYAADREEGRKGEKKENSDKKRVSLRMQFIDIVTRKSKKRKKEYRLEKAYYVVYLFLQNLLTRIEIKEKENLSNKDYSFFVIPPMCFFLSKRTQTYFNQYVNRESVHSKITNLINETDYFIYEMFYNDYYFRNSSQFSKFLASMNIADFEKLNYGFILLQNLFLLIEFYSNEGIAPSDKNERNKKNLALSIIHLFFITIILIIWFYFIFGLEFVHNIMKKYHIKFIFRTSGDKKSHLKNLSVSQINLLNKIYNQVSFWDKCKTLIIDTIILNRQINMIVATFLCIFIYLITGNAIPLSIPVLFLANFNELLFGIILTVKLRWSKFLFVLIYTYLIVYIFAVLAFYYFTSSFLLNVLDFTGYTETEREPMCDSLLQCYLTLLNYGVRSGGGIGDVIDKLAFNPSPTLYIARFFFDILFHIIILLIMTNLIFGIIVDSFAELRNQNSHNTYDKMNVCFICQMTRDSAMNKNLDFDNHRETVHNLWNYVYFLTYLHINNANNFKMLESSLWNKILEMDTSWIPINEKDGEKEIDVDENMLLMMSESLMVVFMVREDIMDDSRKMFNVAINAFGMMNDNEKKDEEYRKKVGLWVDQGKKKSVVSVKDVNKFKVTMERCDKEKIHYIKIDEMGKGKKKEIFMIVIGPEVENIVSELII